MKSRLIRWVFLGSLLNGMAFGSALAGPDEFQPPPRVRAKSQELYRQYEAFVKLQVDSIDEQHPVRYAFLDATYVQTEEALLVGDAWRKWGYWLQGQVLDVEKLIKVSGEWKLVLPAFKVTRGPRRWDDKMLKKVKARSEAYLALTRHPDGYWLVQEVLNRHDFAELKAIGERVALTGKDDTIGVKKSSFRLQMNPMQVAYLEAEKKVRAGEMTEEELARQFTQEMIQAVYDPNNAELVLGKE